MFEAVFFLFSARASAQNIHLLGACFLANVRDAQAQPSGPLVRWFVGDPATRRTLGVWPRPQSTQPSRDNTRHARITTFCVHHNFLRFSPAVCRFRRRDAMHKMQSLCHPGSTEKGCWPASTSNVADMADAAALARNGNPALPAWTMTANGESTTDDRPAILGRGLMPCHY